MSAFRITLAVLALLVVTTAAAQAQRVQAPAAQKPGERGELFGEEIQLAERVIVYFSGSGKWDTAFETVVDAFKTIFSFLEKEDVKPAGNPMMIYTSADDTGFEFRAAIPIVDTFRRTPQGDIQIGRSPSGKAYKFVHRGSYDAMENVYEAITNFFDEKNIDARDIFIEEYVTDPRTTPEDKLVIHVLVPVK
jgi:effector-binding domain-containing protein